MEVRKSARFPGIDYKNGTFFVTICAANMSCFFGRVNFNGNDACVDLSETGLRIERSIDFICDNDPSIRVENHVIMPNHVHILLTINNIELSSIVKRIKSFVQYGTNNKIWQRSFLDHKIRDENDFKNHWTYIENNPIKWVLDKYYRKDT